MTYKSTKYHNVYSYFFTLPDILKRNTPTARFSCPSKVCFRIVMLTKHYYNTKYVGKKAHNSYIEVLASIKIDIEVNENHNVHLNYLLSCIITR